MNTELFQLLFRVALQNQSIHSAHAVSPAVMTPGVIDHMCGSIAGTAFVTRWCTLCVM